MATTLTFTDALNLTRSLLNAAMVGSYTMNDDDRHPDVEIIDAIIGADAIIYNTVAQTPMHPFRASQYVATKINHRALMAAHIGPVGQVLVPFTSGQAANQLPAAEIERLRANPLGLTITGPYFDIVDERLFCSGTDASVDLVPPFQSDGMSLKSPPEYFHAVVAVALAFLFGKEGAEVEAAAHYKSIVETMITQIEKGAQSVAPVIAYQVRSKT